MSVELSILLPAYNVDVRQFVRDLHAQASQLPIRFEIRVYEDASSAEFIALNREISELPNVVHQVEPVNLGRSRIRNKLAEEATFDTLLFIDADSAVPDNSFLKTYIKLLPFDGVLIGASKVSINDPGPEFRLRWLYGNARESKVASTRNKEPFAGFVINNVLLSKELFLKFKLDELISTYGHEDTAFGARLKAADIPVRHIDNPVIHIGLEPAKEFLEKTRAAIVNLFQLYQTQGIGADTKLVNSFLQLKKLGLVAAFVKMIRVIEIRILQNLESSQPNLRLFDIYKLYLFCRQYLKAASAK